MCNKQASIYILQLPFWYPNTLLAFQYRTLSLKSFPFLYSPSHDTLIERSITVASYLLRKVVLTVYVLENLAGTTCTHVILCNDTMMPNVSKAK